MTKEDFKTYKSQSVLGPDQSIDQAALLKCQMLIHRVYAKAWALECLCDEIYQIMIAFASHNYSSTKELTQLIIKTTFPTGDEPKCETLFEFANE